jgi:hypothetical protein
MVQPMKLTDEHDKPIPFVKIGWTLDEMEHFHQTLGWDIEGMRAIKGRQLESLGWLTIANDELVDPSTNWWRED